MCEILYGAEDDNNGEGLYVCKMALVVKHEI